MKLSLPGLLAVVVATAAATAATGCAEGAAKCSPLGWCANDFTCTTEGDDGYCVDLQSTTQFPGPCRSQSGNGDFSEADDSRVTYNYDFQGRFMSCGSSWFEEWSGDGGWESLSFRYGDTGRAIESMSTTFFGPFDYHDAEWTFTDSGATSVIDSDFGQWSSEYEADPQFEFIWPQTCFGQVDAIASLTRRNETTYSYDRPRGPGVRVQTATDEEGNTRQATLTYDSEGRLIRLESETQWAFERSFDERGNLVTYDGRRGPSRFLYDNAGNVRVEVRNRGALSHRFYDYSCW